MIGHEGVRGGRWLPAVVACVAVLAVLAVGLMVSTARADKPVRPSDVRVEASERAVVVSFAAAGAGSSARAFEVSLNDSQWLQIPSTATAGGRMTGTVENLLDGTTYAVRVRAVGLDDTSVPSLVTPATTATTPGEPPQVEARTSVEDGEVVLTFAVPDADEQHGPDGWSVVAEPVDPSLEPGEAVCEATRETCPLRGLVEGGVYRLAAAPFTSRLPGSALMQTVDGAPVDLGEATLSPAPSAPTDLAVVPLDGALALTWSLPTTGPEVEGFEVATGGDGDGPWSPLAATDDGGGEFSATVDGLDNGVPTGVLVRGVGAAGPGAAASVDGTPAGPPGPVRDVGASVQGSVVTLRWAAPRDTGGADIRTYVVSGLDNPGCTTTRTTCTIRGVGRDAYLRFGISADNTSEGAPGTGLGPVVRVRAGRG